MLAYTRDESVGEPFTAMQTAPSNSFERAFVVLELVSKCPGGLTNAELARRLNVASSSCSYILSRLEKFGYLKRDDETGRYEIGLQVLSLAHSVLRDIGLREAADPVLYRLMTETGLSSLIAVLGRGRALLVEKVEGPELTLQKLDIDVGAKLPIHATAVGKVFLAYLPEAERLRIIRQYGLKRLSPRTHVSEERLMRELEQVRYQGFAVNDEENFTGFRAVAAPVRNSSGELCAGISVAGRTCQSAWDVFPSITAAVRAAARDISKRAYC
jgi:IclR family transcriptional regulator, KDG regulon repressor